MKTTDVPWFFPYLTEKEQTLFTVAPELLSALQDMLALYDALLIKPGSAPAVEKAREAIALLSK